MFEPTDRVPAYTTDVTMLSADQLAYAEYEFSPFTPPAERVREAERAVPMLLSEAARHLVDKLPRGQMFLLRIDVDLPTAADWERSMFYGVAQPVRASVTVRHGPSVRRDPVVLERRQRVRLPSLPGMMADVRLARLIALTLADVRRRWAGTRKRWRLAARAWATARLGPWWRPARDRWDRFRLAAGAACFRVLHGIADARGEVLVAGSWPPATMPGP